MLIVSAKYKKTRKRPSLFRKCRLQVISTTIHIQVINDIYFNNVIINSSADFPKYAFLGVSSSVCLTTFFGYI